jgi:hypothetical protein
MALLSIFRPNGMFYGHSVHFGIFFPVLVRFTEKDLATRVSESAEFYKKKKSASADIKVNEY